VVDVVFHPAADAEYEDAVRWYRDRDESAADRFEADVAHSLDLVRRQPESFPRYDDDHRFVVLRKFPYTVVYQVHPDHVFVIAVARNGRAPGYWLGR
jgi:toxin ParE1/3/4